MSNYICTGCRKIVDVQGTILFPAQRSMVLCDGGKKCDWITFAEAENKKEGKPKTYLLDRIEEYKKEALKSGASKK